MNARLRRFRLWLVSVIAPCECVWSMTDGQMFLWRCRDASRCRRRGHRDEDEMIGPSSKSETRHDG